MHARHNTFPCSFPYKKGTEKACCEDLQKNPGKSRVDN